MLHLTRASRGAGLRVACRSITVMPSPGFMGPTKRRTVQLDPLLERELVDRLMGPAVASRDKGKGKGRGKGKGKGKVDGWVERPYVSQEEWELRAESTRLRRGASAAEVVASLDALVSGPLKHNVLHFAAAFDRLCELSQWQHAVGVVGAMWEDPALAALLAQEPDREAAGRGSVASQRERFRHLMNHGLTVCGRTGQWQLALEWVEAMRAASEQRPWLVPDGKNFTAALTACAKALEAKKTRHGSGGNGGSEGRDGACEAALGLFGQMQERGDPIDAYTYNAVIGEPPVTLSPRSRFLLTMPASRWPLPQRRARGRGSGTWCRACWEPWRAPGSSPRPPRSTPPCTR